MRRQRGAELTPILLVVVMVITSGFVMGTTATFTSSTRNAASFIVGGISSPTNPSAVLAGTAATFSYENDYAGEPYNSGVGYRILRKGVGGPTSAGVGPGCASGTYTTLDHTMALSYADATIPSAAADQGEFYCYAAEGVYPCCPASGNTPVITSLEGRAQTAVQTGYVVSSWQFNTGNGNRVPASGEKLVVNLNQPVSVATSITAGEQVCVDPYSKRILVGVADATADSCQWEVQALVAKGTGGNWRAVYQGDSSNNIAYNASAATVQSTLRSSITAFSGANANIIVAGPVMLDSTTRAWGIFFNGTYSGDRPLTTTTETLSGPGNYATSYAVFDGTTEATSLGYLANTGSFGTNPLPTRYDISDVAWSSCTVGGVSCRTATITLGANLGSNSVVLPTGTWTFNPAPAPGRSTSATGGLTLCTTDPAGAPAGGLCRPQAASGW